MLNYRIEAAKKTNAMNMQGYHKKGVRDCAGNGVVLRLKGHLDVDLSAQNVKAPALCCRGPSAAIRRPGRFHAFQVAKSFEQKLRKTLRIGRAACSLCEKHL